MNRVKLWWKEANNFERFISAIIILFVIGTFFAGLSVLF